MKLDRALFVLLTGTLTTAACGATQSPTTQPLAPSASSAAASSAASSAAASTAPASSGSSGQAPSASAAHSAVPPASISVPSAVPPPPSATAVASAPPTAPRPPPIPPEQRKPLGPDVGCTISKTKFDPKRPACDDSAGDLEDCVSLQSLWYPSHEGRSCPGAAMVRKRCSAANANFKPKMAQLVFECLKGAQGAACSDCKLYGCSHHALMSACPDPTADADCETIQGYCSEVDKNRCRSYLSGMTAKGRQAMVDCLKNGCGKGFMQCVNALTP